MDISKTRDHIQIMIKVPNSSKEPPASSKAPNQDFKDISVLCTFKIKIESQKSEHGFTKDQWPYYKQYQDTKPQSETSSILQYPKLNLIGHGCSVHGTFKIKIEGKNLEHGSTKDWWPYINQEKDAKPQLGTSRVLWSPESGLEGHWYQSLYFENGSVWSQG